MPSTKLVHGPQDARRPDEPDVLEPALQAEEIRVGCKAYFSVPEAAESDHKPVLARLAISMPVTDQVQALACITYITREALLASPSQSTTLTSWDWRTCRRLTLSGLHCPMPLLAAQHGT
jgi:hypothetical protein